MTKLLDKAVQALQAASRLPADAQDDLARVVLELAGSDEAEPVALTPEEREALEIALAQAARGEFATDEEVRALSAKYTL